MDKDVFRIIKGYSKLSYSDRKEVRELIDQLENEEYSDRKKLVESFQKSLGPTSESTCPCCGK